ncbi:hypothetical protein P691DRAFT_668629, partial [Macrolepiota fuliginosa MF-IS2]
LKHSAVLEHLAPHTEPGAAMDSSARNPPPRCHPGTRRKIGGKLGTWLDDLKRSWNMMWLHGPAGTGKSAVAQTFAEHCYNRKRLGAAFFFSRPNERNKPETVIPTLAYQLAFHCRGFNIALSKQLADDPQWMTKTPQVQLKRLIIDPFTTLQEDEHERIKEPFMIILDGLDECEGESPQFEFVSMINEAAQSKNLPLLWLICSRPEAHLEYSFSRVAYCGREELLIDRECWDDVNRYLRHELARIKDEYAYIMPPLWPSVDEFNELSWFTAGLFALASTGTKYIDDRTCANPVKQLKKLLSFFKRAEAIGANNPLANLDLLYTQVLTDVPEEYLLTTWKILAYYTHLPRMPHRDVISAQVLCNFLRVDQGDFYSALRRLHSVIVVPSPEQAYQVPLYFYHASFQDFLKDPNRSGRFVIDEQKAWVDIAKSSLFWHSIDTTRFHTNDGWHFDHQHRHASLPNLEWVSPDNEAAVSAGVANLASNFWRVFYRLSDERDEDLSSRVRDLDFRYVNHYRFIRLADWLYRQDPSDPIVHTEPSNELDTRLLEYLGAVTGQGHADPANFPWKFLDNPAGRRRTYFFVGHGKKTIIVFITENRGDAFAHTLNLDKEPSPQQIKEYQDFLVWRGWIEEPDQELELEVESEEEEIEGGSTASGENQDVAIKPEE